MKVFSFIALFLFCLTQASAQKSSKIELLGANSLEYDASLGNNARRLIGDVKLRHDNVIMKCDSAYLYSDNSLDAFGRIHIIQDGVNVYGDFLKYNGNIKKAEVLRNVRMIDKDATVLTDRMIHDLKSNISYYTTGGTVITESNQDTLTSTFGYYYSKTKDFFFKDEVVVINPEYTIYSDTLRYQYSTETAYFLGPTTIRNENSHIYCENGWYDTKKEIFQFKKNAFLVTEDQKLYGDSLYYDKATGIGRVFHNVHIIDTVQNLIINGDFATHYEKEGKSVITGSPILTMISDNDSLFLSADTLMSLFDDTTKTHRVLHAYHNSRFFKSDLQGICDSLVYTLRDSIINLFQSPVLWASDNQMIAEFINIKTANGKVKTMDLDNNAFIVSQEDTTKFNQIKGKNIVATFNDNVLYKIDVKGNSETVYYTREDDGSLFGVNKAHCSDLLIFLKNNSINSITFLQNPEAILYPIEDAPQEELTLKNFQWKAELRPVSKEDIISRNEN